MAMKAPDAHAMPLCPGCHAIRHNSGPSFITALMDPKMVIIDLLTRYLKEMQDGKA
jgi:hypothetical protein